MVESNSAKPDETAPPAPLKPTTAVGQVWITLTMVCIAVGLFAYIVVPSLPREESPLLQTEAPDFTLPVIHGGEPDNRIRLSELRGSIVVLDFWASWCAPCEQQTAILDAQARARPEEFIILGVATADSASAATQYAEEKRLFYPSVHDTNGDVALEYGATDLPTIVVINRDGTVVAVRRGVVDAATIDELIRAAE